MVFQLLAADHGLDTFLLNPIGESILYGSRVYPIRPPIDCFPRHHQPPTCLVSQRNGWFCCHRMSHAKAIAICSINEGTSMICKQALDCQLMRLMCTIIASDCLTAGVNTTTKRYKVLQKVGLINTLHLSIWSGRCHANCIAIDFPAWYSCLEVDKWSQTLP